MKKQGNTIDISKIPAKPRQGTLPGTEDPVYQDLIDRAAIYNERMTERVSLSNQETEARENLIACMHKHGLTTYKTPIGTIVIDVSEKLKIVKTAEQQEAEKPPPKTRQIGPELTGDGEGAGAGA